MRDFLQAVGVACAGLAVLSGIDHVFGKPCALLIAASGVAFCLRELTRRPFPTPEP